MSIIDDLIKAGEIFLDDNKDEYSRYKSWEFCYNKFNNNRTVDEDELALHLSLYLASWGMYRGSTFLINKNYKINYDIIKIIHDFQKEHEFDIKIYNKKDLENLLKKEKFFDDIVKLGNKIEQKYKDNRVDDKNVTDTLKTKIIMGTLGITPAYDKNFKISIDEINKKEQRHIIKKFNAQSLKMCYLYYYEHFEQFEKLRKKTKYQYPIMKVLDMCFWQLGFNLNKLKSNKAK